jgi:chromosome segregation ATPase
MQREVRAGSWADALKRQVATLQAACDEYRAEIGRLAGSRDNLIEQCAGLEYEILRLKRALDGRARPLD